MLFLALFIVVGFTVEAAIGFGATLISLALGSMVMPTAAVLFRVVPLNALLSLAIAVHAWRHIDARRLFFQLLPALLLGMPLGLLVLKALPARNLQLLLAAFVFLLAVAELVATVRADSSETRKLSRPAILALLFAGGVAHGALATGGPPVVYVAARTFDDKASYRATLSALWLLLNAGLITVYALTGRVTGQTLLSSLPLLPAVLVGIFVGDLLHRRVPERAFKLVVFAMLLGVAALLAAQS